MSYDISLFIDAGNGPIALDLLDVNYTWNLGDFFEWVLGKRLGDYNGEVAADLRYDIEQGMEKIQRHKNELSKFNPDNGWGDVASATACLAKIGIACARAPRAKVSVG